MNLYYKKAFKNITHTRIINSENGIIESNTFKISIIKGYSKEISQALQDLQNEGISIKAYQFLKAYYELVDKLPKDFKSWDDFHNQFNFIELLEDTKDLIRDRKAVKV